MKRVIALSVLGVAALASSAQALTYNETFVLTGSQEVPAVSTPGFGAANVQLNLDTTTNNLSWNIIYTNLTSPVTMAHFHGPAAPGQIGPVQVDIGAISGLSSPMVGSATVTDAQEQQILAGLWYINVHTVNNPNGEIRGQLPGVSSGAIPEPASAGMLGLAVVGLLARMRRRA